MYCSRAQAKKLSREVFSEEIQFLKDVLDGKVGHKVYRHQEGWTEMTASTLWKIVSFAAQVNIALGTDPISETLGSFISRNKRPQGFRNRICS